MAKFVVDLEYGADTEHRMQVRPAHREYSQGLAERGILLAAGPYTDDEGAMLVYEVADADELREILDADPYTESGVIESTSVREWKVVTGSWVS